MSYNWAHLPNAKHIDWLLNDIKDNGTAWADSSMYTLSDSIWEKIVKAQETTYRLSRDKIERALQRKASLSAGSIRWDTAWFALIAFISYDDCGKYLDMTPDELRIWGALNGDPACTLLRAMVTILHTRKEMK